MECGDSVAIYRTGESPLVDSKSKFVGTGVIVEVTPRLYRVKANKGVGLLPSDRRFLSGTYLRSSLVCRDGKPGSANLPMFSIMSISPERVGQIEKEINEREEQRLKQKDEEDQRRNQAEYDALPEEIKLARKLQWFCEMNRTETVAQAPIAAIRSIVEWAIANGKEVE